MTLHEINNNIINDAMKNPNYYYLFDTCRNKHDNFVWYSVRNVIYWAIYINYNEKT